VEDCETALGEGKAATVAKAVSEAHGILAELGLSNSNIDAIISEGRNFGALAGKVSGAGGGGAVLLVANKGDGKRVAQALRDAGRAVVATDSKGITRAK
jgi:mevalonate kinase